jgi:hypothetical protein
MKKSFGYLNLILIVILVIIHNSALSQLKPPFPTENFYNKSLHYTTKGLEYWYSKESGGLETLTVVSAKDYGCLDPSCHVRSCDACHLKTIDGKPNYSIEQARSEESCKNCHGVDPNNPDVHVKKGLKCMDCHSKREIHGDGVTYNSYTQPGAMDTRCEKCHSNLSKSTSHTVHKDRISCDACHAQKRVSCYNADCHSDAAIRLNDVFFLVNHNNKVSIGVFQSFVEKNKSMITFGRMMPHKIMKEGRKCQECHNTKIVQDIKNNTFKPFRWEDDTLKCVTGVIPVVDGMKWNLIPLSYDTTGTKWTLAKNIEEPIVRFSGYCTPLTKEQFEKLTKTRGTQ